jgi:hypothetical protein
MGHGNHMEPWPKPEALDAFPLTVFRDLNQTALICLFLIFNRQRAK